MSGLKVSIVIPVYNGSNYLRRAIDCALAQTYPDTEVIVVNDGSTDGGATEHIALSYADRIRYYTKPNGGVSSALNYGIGVMTGDYFSWLSHDDEYSASKIADSVELLEKRGLSGSRTIAFTSGCYIDEESRPLRPFPARLEAGRLYTPEEIALYSFKASPLNGCAMLIPAMAFKECGTFAEDMRYSQDAMMWFRFFTGGYGLISDGRCNVMYRLHGGQASQNKQYLLEHDIALIGDYLIGYMAGHSTPEVNLFYLFAEKAAKLRCPETAKKMIAEADKAAPFSAYQNVRLRLVTAYGLLRPKLKKLYYFIRFGINGRK